MKVNFQFVATSGSSPEILGGIWYDPWRKNGIHFVEQDKVPEIQDFYHRRNLLAVWGYVPPTFWSGSTVPVLFWAYDRKITATFPHPALT